MFVFLILWASDHQIKVMGRYNEELPTVLVYYQTRLYSKLKKNDFFYWVSIWYHCDQK